MGKTVQEKVKEHQALTDEKEKSAKLAEALTQTKCLVADTRTIRKKCVCARCVALKEYKGNNGTN